MKNKKVLLSLLAASLGATLVVGAAYGLFTSEDTIPIDIVAGTVNISASVSNVATYSGEWDGNAYAYKSIATETLGNFVNGGTASVSQTGEVTLVKMSPLDKITFDITIKNNSNLVIKQRTNFSVIDDQGLYTGLEIKADDELLEKGYSYWETLTPGSTDIVKHMSIELVQNAGNEYQNTSCKLAFKIEAVQGNQYTPDGLLVTSQTELNAAIANAEENTVIRLAPSETVYTLPAVFDKTINIVGEVKERTLINRKTAQNLAGCTINLENLTLVGGTSEYVGYQHTLKENYTNCNFTGKTYFYAFVTSFKECSFSQETYDYCLSSFMSQSMTFDSCIFNTVGKAVKINSESSNGTFNVMFKECSFVSSDNSHDKPAVTINSTGANYNVEFVSCSQTNFNHSDLAMESWYSTRMSAATDENKSLVGATGNLDKINVVIDGVSY